MRTISLVMLLLCAVSGCSSIRLPRQPPVAAAGIYGEDPTKSPGMVATPKAEDGKEAASELGHFLLLDQTARKSGATSLQVGEYLRGGFAFSDRLCLDWFTLLERRRQATEFGQGTFSITGSTAGTLLGLARAAAKEIGAVAAVFGGIDSAYNLTKTTFFLTPKLGALREKVMSLRRTMVKDALSNGDVAGNYSSAYKFLMQYGSTCSSLELQRFVDTATDLAKYEYTPASSTDDSKTSEINVVTAELLKEISWSAPISKIPTDALREFYIRVYAPEVANALGYSSPLGAQLAAAYNVAKPNKPRAEVLLTSLGGALDIEKDIPNLKAMAKSATEAKATAALKKATPATPQPEIDNAEAAATKAMESLKVAEKEILRREDTGVAEIRVVPAK